MVTPYLVRPVSANQIALPTDGHRSPDEAQRLLVGQENAGRSGEARPGPTAAQPRTVAPGIGAVGEAAPAAPANRGQRAAAQPSQPGASSAQPGFNF